MKPVVMTLGDICTKGSSNLAQKDLDGNSGEYEIYGASGLIKKVNFFHQEKPYIAVVKDGAGVGRTMLLPAETSVIGTMQYIIPNEDIDIEYLYYAITYMDLSRYYMGAAIPHIYFKDYCKEKILIPDIDIQKAIAHKFRIIDGLITARQEQLAKLGELIASRFIEMFGEPIANPMGWKVKPLKTLSELITNGNTPKGGSENYVESGVIFLRSQNVWRNKIELDDVAYIDAATHQSMKKSSLHFKDILITKTGRINTENSSLGRAALFLGKDDSANINGHVYLVRLNGSILPEFVVTILTGEAYRKYIRKVCVGGIDKRQINVDQVEEFPIITPPMELQYEFVAFKKLIDKSKYLATLCIKLLGNERMMFCDKL